MNNKQLFHKPVEDMTSQELSALLALNSDAVFDLQTELNLLRERDRVLRDEISRRGMIKREGV